MVKPNWHDSCVTNSLDGARSDEHSKEGVSGWSRTSSSSMLPKICGISLAMEYENGNSSARRVDSALEA